MKAILAASALAIALVIGLAVIWGFSVSNSEIRLRNALTAKQRDNQSELDNLQKKITQAAQITTAQTKALLEIIVGNAQARTQKGGTLATLVHEAVPNVDVKVFQNLQNIVTAGRDSWTMRQKEILDLKREHDNVRTVAPGSWVVGGRPEIQVVIVTSDRAEEAFKTGKDNDTDVFGGRK